jgi:diguanylate cyclase (GGDEF)-like protein
MPTALRERWESAINQVFETGQEQLLETEECLVFGEHVFYSRIVPEFDDHGELHSALIISRDMSNLRAAQEALAQRAEREHTLRLITQHMRETLDLDAILATAVSEVQQALDADRTLIFQLTSDHSGVVIQESVDPEYPVTLEMRWEDEHFPPDCYAFYQQGQGRIVDDITQDDWGDCLTEFMQSVGVQSKMVAPIIQNQPDDTVDVWGLIITHACATRRQWQADELGLLQQVADQLAIAIQQSELHQRLQAANQELERISITDALTQIANRRCFDEILEREWQHAQRQRRELALILCDIDFFKQYNDTYGHPAGDDCIYAVAQALEGCINRVTDCIARYGGEEFAVILPHTDVAGAIVLVQNMQTAIAALRIEHQSHEFADRITLSFGITAATPYPGLSAQMLIAQADSALYQAKQSGRDCYAVVVALNE